eukprot:3934518-Rhodomonas_salina.1
MVTQAMALAQLHIERAGEDDEEEAGAPTSALATGTRLFEEIASDEEEDIDFLAEDLKKRQQALAILQGPTQRCEQGWRGGGHRGRGGGGGYRGGMRCGRGGSGGGAAGGAAGGGAE